MKNFFLTKAFLLPLCLLLFSAGILSAATITVTTTVDGDPGSLRDAVASSINGDDIVFDSSLDGLTHTLSLGEIVINTAITITGNGISNTILDGGPSSRMFNITASPVSISGIFFQSGFSVDNGGAIFMNAVTVDITDCFFNGNTAAGALATQGGGAIFNDGGTLTILNSIFNDNAASTGSGSGGAIFNGPGGTLTITGGSMTFNAAQRAGGAIEDNSGAGTTVNLTNVTMDTNFALTSPGNGGAIHVSGAGNININGGTAANNYADNEGGGFWNGTGTMNIVGTTIVTNQAAGPLSDDGGGGVFNAGGIVNIRDANISDNLATGAAGSGGAILNNVGGTLNVFRTTMNNNTSVRAGGAIEDNSGAGGGLNLNQVTVNNNTTSNAPGNGGGLHITGAGNSTIENSTFDSNTASAEGGGIWNGTGSMLIENTNIGLNQASGDLSDQGGGGVFNAGGTLKIRGGTITGNVADGLSGSGGGILNDIGGTLTVLGGAISGNSAMRAGGGIEDNSGAGSTVSLSGVNMDGNSTASAPGNGGGMHVGALGIANIRGGTVNNNTASLEGGGLWTGAGSTMTVVATTIDGNTASGAAADNGGGGLYNDSGNLSIRDAVISNNVANGAAGSGGGILNNVNGALSVFRTTISGNTAVRAGGGIEDVSGDTTVIRINQSIVSNNDAGITPGNGGGLHITGNGGSVIEDSDFNTNVAAAEGGGIWNGSGNMLIENTSINLNVASGDGADQGGGGLFNAGGTVKIRNGEINSNTAVGLAGSGGGILNDTLGSLTVLGTTIRLNTSVRAGGGIEDNSRGSTTISLRDVILNSNTTASAPGNGGGLHITGDGNANIRGGTVNNNNASLEGGGLWNGSGTMNVVGTRIAGNIASGDGPDEGGGGIFNAGGTLNVRDVIINANGAVGLAGSGGGILNDTLGMLRVFRSSITNNVATRAGGGVEDNSRNSTTIRFNQATISTNTTGSSPGNGGGIHITGNGNSLIENSNINTNAATAEGGGIWNGTGSMLIQSTNILGNFAAGIAADQGGGGVFNAGGTIKIRSGSVSQNQATGTAGSGGGILNDVDGTLTVLGTLVQGNRAQRAGGGIEDNSGAGGNLGMRDVGLDNNDAGTNPGNGGGLHITGAGNSNIRGGTVRNNRAASEGGGLWNGSGNMRIVLTNISGNTASGNNADNGGGGVFNASGIVAIRDATIANNNADGTSGSGGGILNDASGTLTVFRSTISNNTSSRAGGGIEDNSGAGGMVTLNRVAINDNDAGTNPGSGGGMHITGAGNSTILNSEIFFNDAAAEGGGLWNGSGTMTITTSTIDDNASTAASLGQGGGGLWNQGGTVNINTSTFSNNVALTGAGGGLVNVGGTMNIVSSTIAEGIALVVGGITQSPGSTTTLSNTIVALNSGTAPLPNGNDVGGMGTFVSNDYNFIGSDDGINQFAGIAQANDQVGTFLVPIDPELGPLQANGGLTLTHAVLCPSPLIDAGNPAITTDDQRGLGVFGGTRDIGAFELQSPCPEPIVDNNGNQNLVDLNTTESFASSVYPNPVVNGRASVQIPETFGEDVTIRVMDMRGTLIMEQRAYVGTEEIDFARLPKGTYTVQVISPTVTESHRVIIAQ